MHNLGAHNGKSSVSHINERCYLQLGLIQDFFSFFFRLAIHFLLFASVDCSDSLAFTVFFNHTL